MQGVEEEYQRQVVNVDAEQVEREAGVEAAKQALRDALNERLANSIASLDATVIRLAERLLNREDGAIAKVAITRASWEQEIDDERARILWAIKELVWKLGYSQGYVYGAHDGHDAELLQAITALKEEYEAAIVARLQAMEERVAAELVDGDAANAAAWAELQGEFDRLRAEMKEAVDQALVACEQILAAARAAQNESISNATEALYAFIDGRLAAWAAQHAQELANAQWQEDSYYRYNLIRLLQAKQQAIDDAVAAVKARWAAAMAEERAQGMDFRGEQRTAFREFTEVTTAALETAIAEDDANMAAIVRERELSLDARLDEQQTALEAAMEADRAEMRRRLKEVYNYNTYEFTPNTPVTDHISAPYSHEQHRAFLNRFAYYMKDVLAHRDAQNAADVNSYAGHTAESIEQAEEQNEDLQRAILDQADASEKACNRHADNLLEDYAEKQQIALELLRDFRDAEQAASTSEAEEHKAQFIYAMHILRYAGGRDSGSFGFGNAPSSYYGKGNSLTGIGALDDYRLPSFGLAQVSEIGARILKLNDDPENRDRQEASLEDAKNGFDAMIQACRDRFGQRNSDEQNAAYMAME